MRERTSRAVPEVGTHSVWARHVHLDNDRLDVPDHTVVHAFRQSDCLGETLDTLAPVPDLGTDQSLGLDETLTTDL